MLARTDRDRVAAIIAELDTLRLGAPRGPEVVLPEVSAVTGIGTAMLYAMVPAAVGYAVERWHHHGPTMACPPS